MISTGAAGFWSYAHTDNKSALGEILRLADQIKSEYDLLTGREFELFVDQDDIVWGQEWRDRINSGLLKATFFIPVITPRYFQRPECRNELQQFTSQATSLGLQEFLLPILFSEVEY